jgi:hypothetical protein
MINGISGNRGCEKLAGNSNRTVFFYFPSIIVKSIIARRLGWILGRKHSS